MEASRFDSLAKGLAAGTVSRRKALKIGGGGVLGGIAATLGFGQGTAQAACRKRECSGPCAEATTSCGPQKCGTPPEGFASCTCVKVQGRCKLPGFSECKPKKACLGVPATCSGQKRCNGNSDCPGNQLCTKEFRKFCCPGLSGDKGVCLPKCTAGT